MVAERSPAESGTPISAASLGKRIVVLPLGTRGDVQPYAALCSQLQASGFIILVATTPDNVPFLEGFRLKAIGVTWNYKEWFETQAVTDALTAGDNLKVLELFGKICEENFPETLRKTWAVMQDFKPDLILATNGTLFPAMVLAQILKVPCGQAGVGIYAPTRFVKSTLGEPCCHYWGWMLNMRTYRASVADPRSLDVCRRILGEELGEQALPWECFTTFMEEYMKPIAFQLISYSPIFCPVPADLPTEFKRMVSITGFWVVDKREQMKRMDQYDSFFGGPAMARLVDFMKEGPAPAYLGWGSMKLVSPEHMTVLAVRSLCVAGMRGVVLGGWAKLRPELLKGVSDEAELVEYAKKNIIFIETAPHEWLFPQCSVTVHHGGSGTLAAALRGGVPTIVTPVWFDQFDNADVVQRHGVGLAMKRFVHVTPHALAAAMQTCMTNTAMIEKARSLGEQLREEDGVGNAVRAIDRFVQEELVTGRWASNFKRVMNRRHERSESCFAFLARVCCKQKPWD